MKPLASPYLAHGLRISLFIGLVACLIAVVGRTAAQETPVVDDAEATAAAEEALNLPSGDADAPVEPVPAEQNTGSLTAGKEISVLQLLLDGGLLMIPIAVMLLITLAFTIERALALRREKVMPRGLIKQFGDLANAAGGFDPRKAYRACQEYPCAASNVIRSMLLKIGRPHSEVEHAVTEASEREASRLYSNVRWLNLATAVTPLMGLYGTVWGMIVAFYATSNLQEGQSIAVELGRGIVVALVTTLGGLAVAIPAAILAHYFEGRIQGMFREIDELLFNLLPQVERYEGKLRVNRDVLGENGSGKAVPAGESRRASTKQTPAAAPTVGGPS